MSDEVVNQESKGRTNYRISPAQFVEAWNKANTVNEAVRNLSEIAGRPVPKNVAQARAGVYRSKGINLKKMKAHGPRIDVEGLNQIASNLGA